MVAGWWSAMVPRRGGVATAVAVEVRQPRVNDKRTDPVRGERRRSASAVLAAWSRKRPRVAEVLPLLYLHGLSSSGFWPALEQLLGFEQGRSPQRQGEAGRTTRRIWR